MQPARAHSKRILPVMVAILLCVVALGGRPLHLLEHSSSPPGPAAIPSACGCVHYAPVNNHCLPVQSADPNSLPPQGDDHDPDRCNICLTFLLQSLPNTLLQTEQVVPIEVRRTLPNDRLLASPPWIAATARGPPRD